ANIRYRKESDNNFKHIPLNNKLENDICNGNYVAQLFEDNICDGCVTANLDSKSDYNFFNMLPAFSIVTAPDFFPFVDSNDINKYYEKNKINNDIHFLEGGTLNLSGLRLKANSNILNPVSLEKAFPITTDETWNTVLAALSVNINLESEFGSSNFNTNYIRDYNASTFLPDTASGIFYPGWDATFSNNDDKKERFLATYGLGSPFPEDMKLCAAANGMWPVTSPDAGRTFQGSLVNIPGINRKPSTSIPLLDNEIGYHPNSPFGLAYGETYGWDGEQGPYLKRGEADKKIYVNFTDIGRADYLENCLNPSIGFDMSKLRLIDSVELIRRMDCLKDSIRKISKRKIRKQPEYTKYWLVGAEYVDNWKVGANAFCIANNLIGNNNNWAKKSDGLEGCGYLFVFVITIDKGLAELEELTSKRRNQEVKKIAVCKIAKQDLSSATQIKWVILETDNLPNDGDNIEEWKD
ncbi:MAG: hypothetical protein J0I84_00645, partial [Terrimonas sp.]|nr:hypothetical protein [Terrimonas sp.]